MTSWPALQKGDLIDVVAPAWPSPSYEVKKGVDFLEKQGFVIRLAKDILKKDKKSVGSYTPVLRKKALQKAFFNPDSKAVLCLRGGYGCIHLLSAILKWHKPKKCKPLIGLSDISILHYFVNRRWHWPTLHGMMLIHLADPKRSLKEKNEFLNILQGKISTLHYKNLRPLNKVAEQTQKIEGQIIGGNLMTLQTLIGTPLPLQSKGRILFLEEVGERGYRVDRVLHHLDLSGVFKGVKAVLLGQFLGSRESTSLIQVLTHFFANFRKPVFMGLPCGHGRRQRILPFNTHSILRVSHKKADLTCHTGVQTR